MVSWKQQMGDEYCFGSTGTAPSSNDALLHGSEHWGGPAVAEADAFGEYVLHD